MQSLLDIIAANRKDLKLKQSLLPALGELVYFISCQEQRLGKTIDHWTMPTLVYVVLIRSIGVSTFFLGFKKQINHNKDNLCYFRRISL
jgi:hypothetical protein